MGVLCSVDLRFRDAGGMTLSKGRAAALALIVFVVAIGVGFLVLRRGETTWRASARGVLTVSQVREPEWVTAYKEDLLTRETIVPTYGAIIGDERFQLAASRQLGLDEETRRSVRVRVEALPPEAVVTVIATAPEPRVAEAMAEGVVSNAGRFIASLHRPYALERVGGSETSLVRVEQPTPVKVVVLAAGCGLLALILYRSLLWLGGSGTGLRLRPT